MIPTITGVSELQRNGKRVLAPIKKKTDDVLFLAERNHVFGVAMNIEHYKELLQLADQQENDFWLGAMQSSLSFWDDPSNDAYEQLL